jgi:hypothetical protein
MNITNSAKLTKFNFKPIWDLSGSIPKVRLINDSTGLNVASGKFNYSYVTPVLAEDIIVKDLQWEATPGNITNVILNFAFDRTQNGLTALLAAINGGGYGVWTGSYAGSILTLSSQDNAASLLIMNYALASVPGTSVAFTRTQTAQQVNGLSLCKSWYELYLPDGTSFHAQTLQAPDTTNNWTSLEFQEAIPQIMGHIPWGGTFRVRGYINDGTNTYGPVDQDVQICRPIGNLVDTENNFGALDIYTELKCQDTPKRLYVEDRTIATYQGVAGGNLTKSTKLIFPTDENGNNANSSSTSTASSIFLAIGEDGDAYQLIVERVADYAFGDSSVRIKYKYKKRLEIFCKLSLCALQCSLKKFEDRITSGGCSAQDQVTLLLINSKYNRLISGLLQPDCGVGVPALIEEIKAMLPSDCGCK